MHVRLIVTRTFYTHARSDRFVTQIDARRRTIGSVSYTHGYELLYSLLFYSTM